MQQRNTWVDNAKAIGIILVVYGHVARGLYNSGVEMPVELYRLIDSIIYSFHMPLFFFLSGLFFYSSLSKRGVASLISNKLDAIVYPYIIWSIIQGVIEAYLASYTNGEVTYAEVFALWQPRAQFWFLYALFLAFCLATAVFAVFSERVAVVVLLLSALIYIFPNTLPDAFPFRLISGNFVFFMLGVVFSLNITIERRLSGPIAVALLAFCFVISQAAFHSALGLTYADKGIASLLLALISILFVISVSLRLSSKPHGLLTLIGSTSMAIYLMHILAGSGVRVLLSTGLGIDSFVAHLIIGCLVAIFSPILFLHITKRMKIPYLFAAPISKIIMYPLHRAKRPL